jgi:hypothetical protein
VGLPSIVGATAPPNLVINVASRGFSPPHPRRMSRRYDINAEAMARMAESLNKMMAEKVTFRDNPAVAKFFDGLELVDPGMVQASKWRPASESEAASPAALWAGVARKP